MLRSPTKSLVLPKLEILVALNISLDESHKESRDYNYSKLCSPPISLRVLVASWRSETVMLVCFYTQPLLPLSFHD